MHRPLIKVRQAEQHRSHEQCGSTPEPTLQEVLHPSAEEQLLGHRNKREGEEEPSSKAKRSRPYRVGMQESHSESKRNRDRRVPTELAQSSANVAQTQAQVEADAIQLPNQDESINPRIQQKHLVEDR